jgi:hypothetical protein
MKKQSCFKIIVVASAILISSCSKKDEGMNPPSENPTIYGRAVEAGTDQPLAGAEFITSICGRYDNVFGCVQWNESSTFTGSDGKFTVSRDSFRNHQLLKTGYWSYVNEPDVSALGGYINHRPAPVTAYINSLSGHYDSVVIKLFPITNITVRVRNTGTSTGALLQCRAHLYGTKADNISLRADIDSSFQYPVFGNTENKIFIYRGFPLSDTTGMQIRYIAKGEILSLDISY